MKDEILQICKVLLPKDFKIDDDRLSLYIDIVIQRILNYCNRAVLPEELKFTTAQMVIDMIVENQTSIGGDTRISSISEGDRSVNFDIQGFIIQADEKISKKTELNKFKKLYKTPGT